VIAFDHATDEAWLISTGYPRPIRIAVHIGRSGEPSK